MEGKRDVKDEEGEEMKLEWCGSEKKKGKKEEEGKEEGKEEGNKEERNKKEQLLGGKY